MKLALEGYEEHQRLQRTFGSLLELFVDNSEGIGGRNFLTSMLLGHNWTDRSRHAELDRNMALGEDGLTCLSKDFRP